MTGHENGNRTRSPDVLMQRRISSPKTLYPPIQIGVLIHEMAYRYPVFIANHEKNDMFGGVESLSEQRSIQSSLLFTHQVQSSRNRDKDPQATTCSILKQPYLL